MLNEKGRNRPTFEVKQTMKIGFPIQIDFTRIFTPFHSLQIRNDDPGISERFFGLVNIPIQTDSINVVPSDAAFFKTIINAELADSRNVFLFVKSLFGNESCEDAILNQRHTS
jgi:hypothetical protein